MMHIELDELDELDTTYIVSPIIAHSDLYEVIKWIVIWESL